MSIESNRMSFMDALSSLYLIVIHMSPSALLAPSAVDHSHGHGQQRRPDPHPPSDPLSLIAPFPPLLQIPISNGL